MSFSKVVSVDSICSDCNSLFFELVLNTAGKFEVEEIYNFTQDDLLTEDVLILDTQAEIFVWVGQLVDPKEKQSAFEIGQKYVDMTASLESLAPDVPLYRISEGSEPCFFTTFFSWDSAKANVQGNSFQKEVALLLGICHAVEDKSNGSSGGHTQRASALAALNYAFSSSAEKPSSVEKSNGSDHSGPRQRAAALAALSSTFNSSSTSKPSTPSRPSEGSPLAEAEGDTISVTEDYLETSEDSKSEGALPVMDNNGGDLQEKPDAEKADDDGTESSATKYSYDRLKSKSENPVRGIDFKRRDAYLLDEEFMIVFGMAKEAFYKLPRWKQDLTKKKVDLF
ncbi:hypothetical protein MLD38_025998 [Melastoma candidum]|uniref:Uncharacterized protein n=1 Tax=Melastoma candidum TaxID=119954 RepID=A0ACB9P0D1_9MYRT|nr:hypothetical protein MLD38_025998 [Melastoma candidum]